MLRLYVDALPPRFVSPAPPVVNASQQHQRHRDREQRDMKITSTLNIRHIPHSQCPIDRPLIAAAACYMPDTMPTREPGADMRRRQFLGVVGDCNAD
jgi:hypothetical protein